MKKTSLIVVALAAISSCFPQGTNSLTVAPRLVFEPARPVGGSLVFTVDDANDRLDETQTLELSTLGTGHCALVLFQEGATGTIEGASAPDDLPLGLRFDCYYAEQLRLIAELRGIPDPRWWQTGSFTVELPGEQVEVAHYYERSRLGITNCTASPGATSTRVMVDEAAGAAGSGEGGVDEAFVRRFTIALEFDDVRGEHWGRGVRPCPLIDLSLNATFRVTNDNYQVRSHQ